MPDDSDLAECCNLGYATACPRLPAQRDSDAVRFSIARDRDELLLVFYIFERAHRPGEHGTLEFDAGMNTWRVRHQDPRIQKMAECYLESYLQRRDARALQPTS